MQPMAVHTPEDLPLLLTVPEAARLLRIGVSRAYEMAQRGEIPAIRIGHRVRVPRDELLRMIGSQVASGDVEQA